MLDGASLLRLAQAYSAATKLTLTGIGKRACANDKAFLRLSRGQTITQRTAEIAERWLRSNWPENAVWPEGIPGKPRSRVPAFVSRHANRVKPANNDSSAATTGDVSCAVAGDS
jgi:hypothetical protein